MSSCEGGYESNEEFQIDSSQFPSTPSQTETSRESSTGISSFDCPSTMLREHAKDPYNIEKPETGVRGCKNMNRLQLAEASWVVQEAKIEGLESLGVSAPLAKHLELSLKAPHDNKLEPLLSHHIPQAQRTKAINEMLNVQAVEEADDAISQIFYAHGLSFHFANFPYVKEPFRKFS